MKKEKANAPAQKQSVNDFAHRLTIQLTEQHYVDYAMTHSQDQIQKGRKRAIVVQCCSQYWDWLPSIKAPSPKAGWRTST